MSKPMSSPKQPSNKVKISRGYESEASPSVLEKAKLGDKTSTSKDKTSETCISKSDDKSCPDATPKVSSEVLYHRIEKYNKTEDKEMIKLQYAWKTSKDFIPVFPIVGKLRFLDDWKNRPGRKWPSLEVVEDICSSEFYVIAKPALVEPEIDKDFCLALNNAELKLADAMTDVQRIVMLVIKAFQKGILKEHSDEVTSFHWKTVIYWVSERTDQSVLQNNTDENIKHFLRIVLEFMKDSLCEKNLTHFFLPSNLFAGKDENALKEVRSKVTEIYGTPIEKYLKGFIVAQQDGEVNYDMVPMQKIKEFNHTSGCSEVELILRAIEGITSEGIDKLKSALEHVASEGHSFFIDDAFGGWDKDHFVNRRLRPALSHDFTRNALIEIVVSQLLNGCEGAFDLQEILENVMAPGFLQPVNILRFAKIF